MNETAEPTAKVLFRVAEADGEAQTETLWAYALGDDLYKLDNLPFFAYSVSWSDVIRAPFVEEEGFPVFAEVTKKSGNRTVRVVFEEGIETGNETEAVMKGLVALGCSYEGANKAYFSVNIPPEASLEAVRDFLVESGVTWEHADPTYTELYGEEA